MMIDDDCLDWKPNMVKLESELILDDDVATDADFRTPFPESSEHILCIFDEKIKLNLAHGLPSTCKPASSAGEDVTNGMVKIKEEMTEDLIPSQAVYTEDSDANSSATFYERNSSYQERNDLSSTVGWPLKTEPVPSIDHDVTDALVKVKMKILDEVTLSEDPLLDTKQHFSPDIVYSPTFKGISNFPEEMINIKIEDSFPDDPDYLKKNLLSDPLEGVGNEGTNLEEVASGSVLNCLRENLKPKLKKLREYVDHCQKELLKAKKKRKQPCKIPGNDKDSSLAEYYLKERLKAVETIIAFRANKNNYENGPWKNDTDHQDEGLKAAERERKSVVSGYIGENRRKLNFNHKGTTTDHTVIAQTKDATETRKRRSSVCQQKRSKSTGERSKLCTNGDNDVYNLVLFCQEEGLKIAERTREFCVDGSDEENDMEESVEEHQKEESKSMNTKKGFYMDAGYDGYGLGENVEDHEKEELKTTEIMEEFCVDEHNDGDRLREDIEDCQAAERKKEVCVNRDFDGNSLKTCSSGKIFEAERKQIFKAKDAARKRKLREDIEYRRIENWRRRVLKIRRSGKYSLIVNVKDDRKEGLKTAETNEEPCVDRGNDRNSLREEDYQAVERKGDLFVNGITKTERIQIRENIEYCKKENLRQMRTNNKCSDAYHLKVNVEDNRKEGLKTAGTSKELCAVGTAGGNNMREEDHQIVERKGEVCVSRDSDRNCSKTNSIGRISERIREKMKKAEEAARIRKLSENVQYHEQESLQKKGYCMNLVESSKYHQKVRLKARSRKRASHVRSKNGLYLCKRCVVYFGTHSDLKTHELSHSSTNCKSSLQKHLMTHSTESLFMCDRCGAMYHNEECFKNHVSAHYNENAFACDQCPAKFNQKATLKNHMLTHSSEEAFFCDQCPEQFKRKHELRDHLLNHSNDRTFACEQCSARFNSPTAARKHLVTHSQREFLCIQCSAKFKSKPRLKQHLITHSNEKLFLCDKCSAQFHYRSDFKRHFFSHIKTKPFSCDQCSGCFKHQSTLQAHLLRHSDGKVFTCDTCLAYFKFKLKLQRHLMKHLHEASSSLK